MGFVRILFGKINVNQCLHINTSLVKRGYIIVFAGQPKEGKCTLSQLKLVVFAMGYVLLDNVCNTVKRVQLLIKSTRKREMHIILA